MVEKDSNLYSFDKAQEEAGEITKHLDRQDLFLVRKSSDISRAEKAVENMTSEEKQLIIEKERQLGRFMEVMEREFSLTPWDLVETSLETSATDLTTVWKSKSQEGSPVYIEITTSTDDDTWSGGLKWFTSSGHYTEIDFEENTDDNANYFERDEVIRVKAIRIGDDQSRDFYRIIQRMAELADIPVTVIKNEQREKVLEENDIFYKRYDEGWKD
jgi:hypothetical protein